MDVKQPPAWKSSSQAELPEPFIESICMAFEKDQDIYAMLAVFAYVVCHLRIGEIREMFIISDRYGVRKASREFVRQKIVGIFQSVQEIYESEFGGSCLSPIYADRNLEMGLPAGIQIDEREERGEKEEVHAERTGCTGSEEETQQEEDRYEED